MNLIKYSLLRYFDKKIIIILAIFVIYSTIQLFTSLIMSKLGLSSPMIQKESFMSIAVSNMIQSSGLFISIITIFKFASEIKNNNLLLIMIVGRKKSFFLKDLIVFYITTIIILFISSAFLISIFIIFFHVGAYSSFDLANLFTRSLSTTLMSFLLSIIIVFFFKSAIISILIYLGYSFTENILGFYYHMKLGYPLDTLPFRLSNIIDFNSITSIGLFSTYIILLMGLQYLVLMNFFKNPNIIVED